MVMTSLIDRELAIDSSNERRRQSSGRFSSVEIASFEVVARDVQIALYTSGFLLENSGGRETSTTRQPNSTVKPISFRVPLTR